MKRNEYLAHRLREVFLDGRWIANTNYKEQLTGLTRAQATHRVGNLNTIAALTFHINYYLAGLLEVLQGGPLTIRDKYSFDLPPITSDAQWEQLVQELLNNAGEFADTVAQLDDTLFDQPFLDEKYGTYLRNIEGVLEHSYYHLGQISLLKKMLPGHDPAL